MLEQICAEIDRIMDTIPEDEEPIGWLTLEEWDHVCALEDTRIALIRARAKDVSK